jgi:hypothetical protein
MTQHRAWIAAAATGLGLATLVGLPALAQEDGGLRLSFGLSARVESISNPGLTLPAEPTRERFSSRLSFGLTDTTRTGSVALSAAGTLSADNDDESEDGLINPDLRLSLKRIGATSSAELSAFLRESDLDTLRGFVLDPETGEITEDVTGNGTRRQTGGRLALSFGDGGPWGGTLSAGLTDTTFTGDTSEVDNRRTNLDGTLRFDLDAATEVSAGLGWSRFEEDGDDPRDTLRPEISFRRDRPAGFVSANVFAEDTEDGTRAGLSFGRSWELPDSSFAFNVGATRGVTGNLSPTGTLTWQKDLPKGSLSASLSHDVTAGDDDQETIVTTASLGLSQSISPLSSLNFGLNASDSEDTLTDQSTQNASLSASYSHSLPYDWMLDAGVTHRIRNEDNSGEATSDTVFLELRRAFEWRP